MSHIKERVYIKTLALIQQSLDRKLESLEILQESLLSETKSSAGDKHETGRAMIQLEREQLGNQLAQIENEKAILQRINPKVLHHEIRMGSWVKTNQFNYFISISLGKISMKEIEFYAISANSPMGQLLMGKRVGDSFQFRNQEIMIQEIS